ncbi:glycoside hydrolase family 19 protein [Colwellia psychrerythraea]|uniref:Glycoside hydrolase family 19 n=1 Tax=Colwellia psychrerythraea TaxID=28229 RepID=A0A099KB17_COLPS|nr:glycoside hydrolase family 19 protein [Colwellia psychrerythraea]KGJ87929.1 glycoside hydrolase family 19 [Colwellia psychrerythraea]
MTIVLSKEQLQAIMPAAKVENIEFYLTALNNQLSDYQIISNMQVAHFIAQIAHESGSFKYRRENLNYSAKALRAVFGKYFPSDEMAEKHARNPESIANIVYANRMGNGDSDSGDGWRYRGRGLIQLTGRNNYTRCGSDIGLNIEAEPELLAKDAETAVAAACWYWQSNKLNGPADQDDIRLVTRKINGGYHGLEERIAFLNRAKEVLNVI